MKRAHRKQKGMEPDYFLGILKVAAAVAALSSAGGMTYKAWQIYEGKTFERQIERMLRD